MAESFYRRAFGGTNEKDNASTSLLSPMAPAPVSAPVPNATGALRPPGELGRTVSTSESHDKASPRKNVSTDQKPLPYRTIRARHEYERSVVRAQKTQHAQAAAYNELKNKRYSQLSSFCYDGMEVVFAVSTDVCFGICARTHLVFQQLTLQSTTPVASLVACPETGQVCILHTDGVLQTYLPSPTDPLETSFGKFRWYNGPRFRCADIFYVQHEEAHFGTVRHTNSDGRSNPADVSLSHNYKICVAHRDQLCVLDARPLEDEEDGDVPNVDGSAHSATSTRSADLLWTTRLPDAVIATAKISGNGCSIACVTVNNDPGVHTFERDWDDGGLLGSSMRSLNNNSESSFSSLPRPDMVGRASSVGILYKPGPFLVHNEPVTKLAFRGLGHRTAQHAARNQYDDDEKLEANDLLLTYCTNDGVARIYEQKRWRVLTEWTTPESTRVDWVKGISAFTLGDLESPRTSNSSRGRTVGTENDESMDTTDVLRETLGKRDHLHSLPSHTTPFSSAGAWVSEITFHGPLPTVRLSRLTYLKRGMDEASPTLFESVSAYLPPGSLFRNGILDMDGAGLSVEGIWPAWNPWLSETVNHMDHHTDTLRGSAMSFLGLSSGPALGGGHAFGDNLLGGTLSPPCEVRFSACHPISGRITVLDCRVFGDKSQLELEAFQCSFLSLSDMHSLCGGAKRETPQRVTASCDRGTSRLVASANSDNRSIDVVWRRPGTMSLLPSTWMPEDVARTGELLANATVFRDESLIPLPIALPPLILPKSISDTDSIRQLLWSKDYGYDGPSHLFAIATSGTVIAFEIPPPSTFLEACLPSHEGFSGSIFNDDMLSLSSDQRLAKGVSRPTYNASIVPDPDHGLGLRLESMVDGSCAIAGSYKKNPLNGEELPAEKCGLISLGDELLSVNGVSLEQKSFDEIIGTVREVGAASEPGTPLVLTFRSIKRLVRRNTNISIDSGRRSMEQILGVTNDDLDGEAPTSSDVSRASQPVPIGELAFNLDVVGSANMIVGEFLNAIPPYPLNTTKERATIIPLDILAVKTSEQKRILAYLHGNQVFIAVLSFSEVGAGISVIASFAPEEKSQLLSLAVFGPSSSDCFFSIQTVEGHVYLGTMAFSQTSSGQVELISNEMFQSFSISPAGSKLVGFSPRLIASTFGDNEDTIRVWSALPQTGNIVVDSDTGSEEQLFSDYVSLDIIVDDAERGNRVLDFSFVATGYLDESPALLVFSLFSVDLYTRIAASDDWTRCFRILYEQVRGSEGRDVSKSPGHARLSEIHPFDAFPHMRASVLALYESQDEAKFIKTDWHPESLLASVCLDNGDVGVVFRSQIVPVLSWLETQLELAGKEIRREKSLACTPLLGDFVKPTSKSSAIGTGNGASSGFDGSSGFSILREHLERICGSPANDSIILNGGRLQSTSFLDMEQNEARLLFALSHMAEDSLDLHGLDPQGKQFMFTLELLEQLSSPNSKRDTPEPPSNRFLNLLTGTKTPPTAPKRVDEKPPVASSGALSALSSGKQSAILDCIRQRHRKLDWETARQLRLPFWLRCESSLAKVSEEIGQTGFREDRDVMESALFFIAAKKMRTLRNLAATDRTDSGRKFFKFLTSYDFSSSRGRQAAEKNAYSLLRKCKYRVAAAFFLLADPPYLKPALETIATKLMDFDLAFLVARLMTNADLGDHEHGTCSAKFGYLLGGGGGYANPLQSMPAPGNKDNQAFGDWKPKLSVVTKNLLVDRIMPAFESDVALRATVLLWLEQPAEAYCTLSSTIKVSTEGKNVTTKQVNPISIAFPHTTKTKRDRQPTAIQEANFFIDFVSAPKLLFHLDAPHRARFTSSLAVGTALQARGYEIAALKSILAFSGEESFGDDYTNENREVKDPAQAPKSSIYDAPNLLPHQAQSSIFDAYSSPNNAPEIANGKMESSVFDSFGTSAQVKPAQDMQSSIFDSYDPPSKSDLPKQNTSQSAQVESSIFDSFDVPRQAKPSSVGAHSSIFDAFDPPVKGTNVVSPRNSGTESSIFDEFDPPRPAAVKTIQSTSETEGVAVVLGSDCNAETELGIRFSVLSSKSPKIWKLWKTDLVVSVAARRLIREIARVLGEFYGDPPGIPIDEFFNRDMLVPPGVSGVLQVDCDGSALISNINHALSLICEYTKIEPYLIVLQALRLLGKSKERLLFAVVLHVIVGRDDLAEKVLRFTSKMQMDRCCIFAFVQGGFLHSRLTRSHSSTQFLRRETARLSWQLESSLWIHRGGALPMSTLSMKEAVCAVRVGLFLASWDDSYECLLRLIQNDPDCVTDDEAGRHLWSSFETPDISQDAEEDPRDNDGGGWEFLVDCRRSQATELLRDRPTGCFIIRPHSQDPGVFTLSFKTNLVPTEQQEEGTADNSGDVSGDELSDGDDNRANSDRASKPVKKSDIVQHAIIRLSETGFRCGSFGPFISLMALLEAVSASLPFKLRFDKPPANDISEDTGRQTSPNAVLFRKLALRHANSISSNPPDTGNVGIPQHPGESGAYYAPRHFPYEHRNAFSMFVELSVLSLIRRQLSGVAAVADDEIGTSTTGDVSSCNEEAVEIISNGNSSVVLESHLTQSYRILGPLLVWCRTMEVRVAPQLSPLYTSSLSSLSNPAVDVTESADAIEVAATEQPDRSKFGSGGDAILRRLIQQDSGVEFTTLRLVDGGEYTVILLFSRKDAVRWLVERGLEQSLESAEARLHDLNVARFIEPVDLHQLPLKQKGASVEEGVRYRFVDPWEVEPLGSREGETKSAFLGRSRLLTFSLGCVSLRSEAILREIGGLPLLELWTGIKGDVLLTKALASVHSPWERAAGGDLIESLSGSAESSPYLNSVRQYLYRASLFKRLELPQRFVALVQVELLDLKNLTSPGGSLSLNVYSLLKLKRSGSGSPLTNKTRTLDSTATQPVKLSKSSGPNAPASWGSVVRFRFPLPEDVSIDGTSPDHDCEILFRGPPTFLQLSVYERKLLVDHSLGTADVSMDGLWAGGQLEEWVPLRSDKHGITWFARIRLTLRFELMVCADSRSCGKETPSVALKRIEELSRTGGTAHEDFLEKRSMSSPDLLTYFESMVY